MDWESEAVKAMWSALSSREIFLSDGALEMSRVAIRPTGIPELDVSDVGQAMSDSTRIGVAIDSELLRGFDRFIEERGYENRSQAFLDRHS
jgi:hypothetical protein